MNIKNIRTGMIISAIFYIGMGVVMVLFPSTISLILCYLFGGIIGVIGIAKIIRYFTGRADSVHGIAVFQFDLIVGMLAIVVSALFLLQPEAVRAIIPIVIGVALLTDAIIKFQLAFQLKNVGYDKWWISLILAVICTVAAVLLITNPFRTNDILIMVAGVSFIVDGLMDAWSIIYVQIALKKIKNAAKQAAEAAQAIPAEPQA